jgi:hypothetical protein
MPAPTYAQFADRVTDRIVAGVKRIEDAVAISTGNVAGLASRGPKLPIANRIAGRVPSVQAIAATNFGVLEKLLGAQKQYALHVLTAASGRVEPAPVAPTPIKSRAARKPAAKA